LNDHEGIQKCIAKIGTGDILGEMGLLRGAPRSATVVATEDSELLPINWKVIQRLQWLYPPTAQKFFVNMMGILCDRVERLTVCLAHESLIDDLTGLKNRKGFARCLEQEANRARRLGQSLQMAVIEFTFSDNNDDRSTEMKNRLLRSIGEIFTASIRRCDLISRIDTDLFAMLIAAASEQKTRQIRARLQEKIDGLKVQFNPSVDFAMTFRVAPLDVAGELDGEQVIDQTLRKIGGRGTFGVNN